MERERERERNTAPQRYGEIKMKIYRERREGSSEKMINI